MVVTATGSTAMPPLLHLYFCALLLLCSFQASRHQSIPQSITYSLEEEAPVDTLVGKVSGDSGIKEVLGEEALSSLRYSLLSKGNQYSGLFQISSTGGFLTVAGRIDRETLCPFSDSCQLSLEVAVQSSDGFFKNVKVEVVIRDKNDNSPTFPRQSMTLNVSEAVSRGFTLSLEPASDKDASENYSVQSYMLEPQSAPFTIVQSHNLVGIPQLSLVVSGPLDREVVPVYNLTVWAYDGGQPPRAGAMTVSVLVLDVNDNAPTFTKAVYSVNVSESAPEGTAILTVSATDPDDGDNAALQYTISAQQPASERQKLRVGAKDGVVTLAKALNVGVHRVLVEVQDGGSPPMAAQAVVQVTVLDTDNNPPALNVDLLSVLDMKPGFVPERAKVSTAVAYMAVSDPDTNANGIVTCSCHSDRFDLQPLDLNEYKVIINMPLDREEEDHYTVLITCADGGSPRLSASATFDIWVVDANDNAPAFLQKDHFVSVAENNSPSDGLIQVAATDADSGDNANVTYSLLGAEGNFQIGAQNGLVKVIHKFNYEQRSRYVFYVLATDHGDPPLTSTATVTVNVLDVNDEVPTFSAQEYVMSVDESVKPGTYIGNVSAFDPDTGPGGQVVLSIVQSLGSDFPIPFAIRNTGVIVTTGPLDREQRGSYVLYVMAKDQGSQPLSSTALVRIDILDINDNPPQFVFPENGSNTYTLPIPVQANFIVGTVRAVDPDSGLNSVVSYSTVGGNSSYFRVDEFTGSLITARDMDEAQVGSYYLLVRATDKGSPPLSSEQKISLYVTRHVSGELTGDDDRYIVIVIVIVVFTVVVAAGVFTTLCVLRKLDQDRKLKYRAACCPDTDAGGQLEMSGTQCPADNQQVHSLSHDVEKMSKRGCSSTSDSAYASSEVGETGSHTIGSSSMLGLPRQRTCYVRGSQSFMLTPSYGQQGRKAPLFHPETGHRADDFHSTSSTETTAGDSGHGSDEETPSSSSVHNIRRGRCADSPLPSCNSARSGHGDTTFTPLPASSSMNTSFYFDTPLSTFSRSLQPHGTAGGKVREGRNPNNVRFSPNVTYENSSAHPPFQTRGRCAASDEDSELDTTTSGSYSVATDDVYGDWVHHAGAIYSNGNGSGEGHYKNVEHDLLV